jgi:tetratricopeptide (TPR) repeat protein
MSSVTEKLKEIICSGSCLLLLGMPGASYAREAEKAPAAEIKSARDLMQEHRYSQADLLLFALSKKYPNDDRLPAMRGGLLREIGKFDEASGEFARAAQLCPANPFPLVALAQLCLKQMELEKSVTYAQQAVGRDPKCVSARLTLVDVLLQCGQTAEAERQLKCLPGEARVKPEAEQLAYRLSLKKGDLSGARNHLQRAFSGSTQGGIKLLMEDSELLQTMGENNAARAELEKVILGNPDSLTARLRLARLLETQYHDYAAALTNYKAALRIDPLSAQAIAGYDRCLLKRRNIALQIKMALREFWTNFSAGESEGAGQSVEH